MRGFAYSPTVKLQKYGWKVESKLRRTLISKGGSPNLYCNPVKQRKGQSKTKLLHGFTDKVYYSKFRFYRG
jgi:hypothetical protein